MENFLFQTFIVLVLGFAGGLLVGDACIISWIKSGKGPRYKYIKKMRQKLFELGELEYSDDGEVIFWKDGSELE